MLSKFEPYRTKKSLYITIAFVIGLFLFFKTFNNELDLEMITELARNDSEEKLSKKIDDLTEKLIKQQELRLLKLEQNNNKLERQLNELKKPSEDLSLREKLAFVYPYDQKQKFPAYIWQAWKYGLYDDKFGKDYKLGEEQWAVKNPGFVHDIFNDDTLNAIIRYLYINVPEVIKAFESLPHMVLKMDFFRFLILFANGGVYADIDTIPILPIPNWLPENVDAKELGMVISVGSDSAHESRKKFYTRRLQFANWVIQSKPGHPILREVIASITEETLEKASKNSLFISGEESPEFMLDVMDWTGGGRWTDVILSYFNDYVQSGVYQKITWKDFTGMEEPKLVSDVLIFPLNSFSAGNNKNEPDKSPQRTETDPLAFVKHYKDQVFLIKD